MKAHSSQSVDWPKIMERIAAGETQSAVAEQLGMSRSQLRYRLQKFIVGEGASAEWDLTLWDDSWKREWQVTHCVLMVKEPSILHVYWEVEGLFKDLVAKNFRREWNRLPFFLQVYDVTDTWFDGSNANDVRRVEVDAHTDNWYVHGVQPGRRYVVDFGTTTWSGAFFAIVRSNVVETPPRRRSIEVTPSARFRSVRQGSPS